MQGRRPKTRAHSKTQQDQGGRYDSHLALGGLLFARRIAGRLHREEWMNTCELLPTGVLTGSDGVLAGAGHHIGQ
jgi:hypothetical protein